MSPRTHAARKNWVLFASVIWITLVVFLLAFMIYYLPIAVFLLFEPMVWGDSLPQQDSWPFPYLLPLFRDNLLVRVPLRCSSTPNSDGSTTVATPAWRDLMVLGRSFATLDTLPSEYIDSRTGLFPAPFIQASTCKVVLGSLAPNISPRGDPLLTLRSTHYLDIHFFKLFILGIVALFFFLKPAASNAWNEYRLFRATRPKPFKY